MTPIPKKLRSDLAADPSYKRCMRRGLHGHECDGRITFEHAKRFAGRQIQAKWAILAICAKGHSVDRFQDGGDYDAEIHEWIALNRASDQELREISKAEDYFRRREYLNSIYGVYKPGEIVGESCVEAVGIMYESREQRGDNFGQFSLFGSMV